MKKKVKLMDLENQRLQEENMKKIYAGAELCGNTCDCSCSCEPGNNTNSSTNMSSAKTSNRNI